MKNNRIVKLSQHIDLKNTGYFFLAIFIYSCFFQALYNLIKYDNLLPYRNSIDFCISFVKNFIPISVLGILNVIIVFKFPLPDGLERKFFLKSIIDLTSSLIGLALVNLIYLRFAGYFSSYSHVYTAGTILSDILILLFVEIIYYFYLSKETNQRSEEIKRQALEYRYDALKSQINPHFLFNSLNILYSLIDLDKEKSKKFTLALTDVYRHVLSFRNRSTVTLEEELELLKTYVEVLSMRFHNQLFVEIIDEKQEASHNRVIPFSLQLLFENVIKHNEVSSRNPMKVIVEIKDDEVEISNRINARHTSSSSGIGLNYIEQQYKRFGKMLHTSDDGHTFSASIPYL